MQWLQKLSVPSVCGKNKNRKLKNTLVLRSVGKSPNDSVLHYGKSEEENFLLPNIEGERKNKCHTSLMLNKMI